MSNIDGNFHAIYATRYGQSPRRVAVWRPRHANGPLEIYRKIVERAAEVLSEYWRVADAFRSDQNLSKKGADQQVFSAATKNLAGMRGLVEHFESERRQIEFRRTQLIGNATGGKRAKDDVTGTMIDIELARAIKDMKPADRAILLSVIGDPELQRVALHMPPALTGIKADERETITQQLIERYNPAELEAIAELQAAADSVAEGLRSVYDLIGEGMTIVERRTAAPAVANYFEPPVSPEEALAKARAEAAA